MVAAVVLAVAIAIAVFGVVKKGNFWKKWNKNSKTTTEESNYGPLTWQLIGPGGGGRITSVTEDPSNSKNLYVTINVGGARKSTDGGKTWQIINRGLAYDKEGENAQRLMGISVHPEKSNVVLAAGLNGYIYESTNGGEQWKTSYKNNKYDFSQIAQDPTNSNGVYVGVGSIQKLILGVDSLRTGEFWDKIAEGPTILHGVFDGSSWKWSEIGSLKGKSRSGSGFLNIYSIAVNPADGKMLFFMTERGLFRGKTGNNGKIENFEQISNGLPDAELIHGGKIIFDPVDKNKAYLTVLNVSGEQSSGGVFKSVDGGNTWKKLTAGLDASHSNYFDISLDPKNHNLVYAAQTTSDNYKNEKGKSPYVEGNLYFSGDQGDTWKPIIDVKNPASFKTGWLPMQKYGPDFIAISSAGNKIYWSIGGGKLFVNENDSAPYQWKNMMTQEVAPGEFATTGSEAIALAFSLAIDPKNSNVIYIPYGDHGYFKSDNGGKTVKPISNFSDFRNKYGNKGDSGTLLVDEKDSKIVYAATQGPHQKLEDGGVMWSRDGGMQWETIGGNTNGNERGLKRAAMLDLLVEYDGNQRNLYVASYGNGGKNGKDGKNGKKKSSGGVYMLKNVESQNNWEEIFSSQNVHSLAVRDNFKTIYAGVDGEGVYKLVRNGSSWNKSGLIKIGNSSVFYDMETAAGSETIYMATDTGLYFIDKNDKVSSVNTSISVKDNLRTAVEVYKKNENILYFSSDHEGVFRSEDRGKTWKNISNDIPTKGFVMLKSDPNNDTIYTEPPGGGIWKKSF